MTTGTSENEFIPTWWLPEGHSQTLWRKFSPAKTIMHRRQRIELDDSDYIDLDWTALDTKESKETGFFASNEPPTVDRIRQPNH